MTGETENTQRTDIQRQSVTSVGDAWVICNSKSRPGYKYYFNTLTGQAVWNLSLVEIEKAKNYTKGIPIAEIEKCPEPIDPPTDSLMDPQAIPTRLYDEKIINNQLPNQFSLFPMNLLNRIPQSLSVPSVSGLNPNIWNIPNNTAITQGPGPQVIYVAYQPPMNIPSQEYPQYMPQNYGHNRYNTQEEYSQNVFNAGNNIMSRNRMHDNWGRSKFPQRNVQKAQNWSSNSPDLRQKLTRKRSKSQSCDLSIHKDVSFKDMDANNKNKVTQEPVNNYLQKNTQLEETPSKYDLLALKQLKHPNSKSDNKWFIVVDTEIILNNFQFLNKITDPDQNCYLIVPDHVMTELEFFASNSSDVRTRRIYRFLSGQIDRDIALKGEDMTNIADNDTDKTFATCVDLAKQNNVILLSNDVKLYTYKNKNMNIHVLTINEIKMILKDGSITRVGNKSPTLDIQIVVTNDRTHERVEKVSPSLLKTPDFEVPSHIVKKKEINIQSNPVLSTSKQTKEAEVQRHSTEKYSDDAEHTPVSTNTPESIGFERGSEDSYFFNNLNKKGTKLIRSLSNQQQQANVEENKQTTKYRWRKQRGTKNMNLSKSSSLISDNAIDHVKHHETTTLVDNCINQESNKSEISPKTTFSSLRAPSLDRSSLSSQPKRIERPNVIIEETSTSGVISNTNDSESVHSNSHVKEKQLISICEDVNFVKFQVAGQCMEEVLRTRLEEWMLRFVQIMEEVLREKLRDDSGVLSKDYAAPWATDLPELTKCIIKKFSDHFNVVDAANRLSFTLHRISDDKGIVRQNVEPSQFMEMYSFGVYLIESLKGLSNDCEDLKTADESLKKLLYDIENANLELGHNDTFVDELNESAINDTEPTNAEEELTRLFPDGDFVEETSGEDHNERQSSKGSYMLRYCKKTPIQIQPQQKTPTSVEKDFFSSLELEKRFMDKTSYMKTFDCQDTPCNSPVSPKVVKTPPKVSPAPKIPQGSVEKNLEEQDTSKPDTLSIDKNKEINVKNNVEVNNGDNIENTSVKPAQTAFVRNFTSIAQFEEMLLKKHLTSEHEDDYEDDEYFGEDYEDASYPPLETYDDNGRMMTMMEDDGELDVGANEDLEEGEIQDLEDGEIVDDYKIQESLKAEDNLKCSEVDNNENFRWFMKEFIGEIKETFLAVQKLCTEFVREFQNSREFCPDMETKLRAACKTMLNISNLLNSILDRESIPENNIMIMLKKANLNDLVADEDVRLEYTDIISKCRDQAYTCYKTVTLLMKRAGIRKSVC